MLAASMRLPASARLRERNRISPSRLERMLMGTFLESRTVQDAIADRDPAGRVEPQLLAGRFHLLPGVDALLVVQPLARERVDKCTTRVATLSIAQQPVRDRALGVQHFE